MLLFDVESAIILKVATKKLNSKEIILLSKKKNYEEIDLEEENKELQQFKW